MKKLTQLVFIFSIVFFANSLNAQNTKKDMANLKSALNGFKFRSIGPAFMSGRISDIAIDPKNSNTWYVAVGSGGLWKTNNAGTTWIPLTEDEAFYSTGCVTVDPSNNSTIWLGTGENVGGRHVGIGHGIFKSDDAGSSWKQMGLKKSEHISKIIVHPDNSNIIWVAAQGPLWSSGGQRGLFKSVDGGKTWKNTLEINKWTGVTDLVIHPKNPNILYAASWQRHRNVAAFMGGGPGTSIYKSVDGGDNWEKIDNGLPKENLGKIGLAISPMKPEVLYAAVEMERKKGGFFKSVDAGGSWKKMSATVSGGTGPHYYQEVYASPHVFDRVYLANVRVKVSDNGGKDFYTMKEKRKHSDNHAMVFKKDDPNYILVGTDGGIYETFDNTENWKFVSNLPITQFYKLAVDDAEPFYNIYGGTQDNNTQGGPSRTFRSNGITNSDWYVVLGGDGHQPATEPGNPNILYAQSQEGYLHRIDKTNGEAVNIRPQEGIDEPYERFNWDAPILVSQHNPKQLYFGSQRVWKSENRGDSWIPISGDLTKNEERFSLPIMGKTQSFDNAWDVYAMSTYNTITSLAESKIDKNVLYVGTDDGLIQMTKDGGANWIKKSVDILPKTPSTAFINDIKADLFDQNTAYIALDNHKFGDYNPYLFKTSDGGKTWVSIAKGIPKGTLVWRIVQDHINPNLLFLGTEYGVYITLDQGENWHKFSNGLPTIPVRDLAIQKRENDLVLATFGRSFYILDDYSPLREINKESVQKQALLFTPRNGLQYQQMYGGTSSSGSSSFVANNPKYGTLISYYLRDGHQSLTAQRKKAETNGKIDTWIIEELNKSNYTINSLMEVSNEELIKKTNLDLNTILNVKKVLQKNKENETGIKFPGWEALDREINETVPEIVLMIRNEKNEVVSQISAPVNKGLNRLNWDLTTQLSTAIKSSSSKNTYNRNLKINADPGLYSVSLFKRSGNNFEQICESKKFEITQIRKNTLENPKYDEHKEYYQSLADLNKKVIELNHNFEKGNNKLNTIKNNLKYLKSQQIEINSDVFQLIEDMKSLKREFGGSHAKAEIGEKDFQTLNDRLYNAKGGWRPNTYGPTTLHMGSFNIANKKYNRLKQKVELYLSKIEVVNKKLENYGAPTILD
tara:strand:+ start:2343 stop:5738 length:3396 start_codon:yes stop_codon:yes gene_type:complete